MNDIPVPVDQLNAFAREAIESAGAIAMRWFGKGRPGARFDKEMVTEVELQLVNGFQELLRSRFPDHHYFDGNLAETGYTHDGGRYLWVFDPLDGVWNFAAGIPTWGMSVALLENFWPILGVFHMPASGDWFHAVAGGKAYRGEKEIRISPQGDLTDESVLFIFSRFHNLYRAQFPGKIRNLGCTSAHICYVAEGRAEAALIANESYKDLAAARVIIEAAGGRIFNLQGRPFQIGEYLEGPSDTSDLLVMSPHLFAQVSRCISPV
ncbi:MAG: inositol monophosphatase family protein [Desulfobacterales bacterium]